MLRLLTSVALAAFLASGSIAPVADGGALSPAAGTNRIEPRPAALASADFDEDGVPDLVASYAVDEAGLLALHRGNIDSIYPNDPAATHRKEEGRDTDAPFLREARIFTAPCVPDFVAAGDFDADGHRDVVVAASSGRALFLLAGDGRGGLGAAERLELPGELTAMAAGEINRVDGLADLALGVLGSDGPAVVVLQGPEGAFRSPPEIVQLRSPATALVLGRMDAGSWSDLAVAAGSELLIVYGRDRKLVLEESYRRRVGPPLVEWVPSPSAIEALALGDFVQESPVRRALALLGEDGDVRFLVHRDATAGWTTAGSLGLADATPGRRLLLPARIRGAAVEDVLLLDPATRRLTVANLAAAEAEFPPLELPGPPLAALPMRLNRDARTDFVLLLQDSLEPAVVTTAPAAVITVDTASDAFVPGDGQCSLRDAVSNANADADTTAGDCAPGAGADAIEFDIGGGGSTATIVMTLGSVPLTGATTVDGTTQGCPAPPCVELQMGGFVVQGGSSVVRGLVLNKTSGTIRLESAGNIVEGNFIGTDLAGTTALSEGNGSAVLLEDGASASTIGGTVAAARNLLSGNQGGVVILDPSATQSTIHGNFIGTDVTGTADLGNSNYGIYVDESDDNTIGGTTAGAGNLISNNAGGIRIGDSADGTSVFGNLIGTDVGGTLDRGNGAGISISFSSDDTTVGGTTPAARNVISASSGRGVGIDDSSGTRILGNFIGTDITGTVDLGNDGDGGVEFSNSPDTIVGGVVEGARNIVSGGLRGIEMVFNNPDTFVLGNFVGTDVSGTQPIPNSVVGVGVLHGSPAGVTVGGTSEGARNVISGNGGSGVGIGNSEGTLIQGNFIGTDVSGTLPLGNLRGIGIGGSTFIDIDGNLISANGEEGVDISNASQNVVQRNLIGTDISGALALGNSGGVSISGSSGGNSVGFGNVIAGNDGPGVSISLFAQQNRVQGNLIGVDATGSFPLPNTVGVEISDNSFDNTVGGTFGPTGNVIAGNLGAGVVVADGTSVGNAIQGNSIHSNGGLGIDLAEDGVTANDHADADPGPNELQNFPVLSSAAFDAPTTTLAGTLDSLASTTFRLEFFADTSCDASGHGEGRHFLGFLNRTTDAFGDASFNGAFPSAPDGARQITATATDSDGNTSEFSACFEARCLAAVAFDETVLATGPDLFGWSIPRDVRFVKGGLAGVDSYSFTEDGLLLSATSLDLSGDSPGSGEGVFYVVRPLGCGSWQTVVGNEPDRDEAWP